MKEVYIRKIVIFIVSLFCLFSLLTPTFSLGQTYEETSFSQKGGETLDTISVLPTPSSESNVDSTKDISSTDSMISESSTGEETDAVEERSTQEIRANSQDILDSIVVTDWELYRENNGVKESLTVDPKSNAIPNQAYSFAFSWTILSEKLGRNILPGDYFVLEIPQNEDRDTGHWYAVPGKWQTVTTNDGANAVYRYRVENSADGKNQVIRIEFLDDVDKLHIDTLTSDLTFNGFMNYVTKESVQNVSFGRDSNGSSISKNITFNQIALNTANGFSFKYGSAGSNNSLKWGIQFNGAANVELGGDEVDYNANGGGGNKHQGFYTDKPGRVIWHPWGTNYTDIFAPIGKESGGELGGYVEDELPAGAVLTTLTIASYIPIPIGLTQDNYAKQEGVYPSTTAAFQSYVLADYGAGPTYRGVSDTSEVQRPKQGSGFKLLTQAANETKSQFKARLQSKPYQYGVYKEDSGVSTVMMHYGSMKKAGNEQEKLSDLTNEPYTGREIINSKSGQNVQITQFAAKAADYSIKRGYYAEEDRELLENYYSITFGDSNVIGGKSAAYNIALTVRYPPSTPSGSVQNESAIYTHSALTLNRKEPEVMPKRDGATAELKNPYGSITLNANQALLQKFDVERDERGEYIPINGAKFKLQIRSGSAWEDVKKNAELLIFETDGIQYYEVENSLIVEKTVNGLVKVDFGELGLSNGTYRFVETKSAAGYDEKESPNWSETAKAVVSDTFDIPSTTSRGPTVTVWNKKLPQVKYTVEHYVQKSEENKTKENFELRKTEEKLGYLGQEVVGEPLMELLTSYEYDETLSIDYGKTTGKVTEDGSLTLQLYYTIAAEVPFTLYKQGMNGEMMPSVDSSGNPLYDEQGREMKVAFDIYEWDGKWDNSNPYNIGNGPKGKPEVWTKVNEEPLTTDALGRIRVPEITDLTKYYAIVEVETYPDYVLPYNSKPENLSTYREVYWVVRMSTNLIFSAPSWAHGTEVDKPDFEAPSESNGKRYILKNRKSAISLFKVNENDEPMPSSDKQKVQFDIYRWNSGGYFDEKSPYTWSQWSKFTSEATTDNQGFFAKIGQTGLNGSEDKNYDWYLIRETNTYSGYEKAEGHWLVKTAWNKETQQFEIFDVKYKILQGNSVVDGEDPGHKVSDNKTELYLTNKAKAISFTKEDGKQNPLGGAHFSLYKPKEGEPGSAGSEDPTASDTKWDMANPTELISNAGTGEVDLGKLTRGSYLLMETKTVPGYQLPLGYWIVTINFYGEIETIRGRGDPLPPAFRVENGKYYLPNYLKNSLPKSGGYMRIFWVVLGIVLLGSAIIILENKKNTPDKRKGEKKWEDD
ncbi:MAG: prealbumin-like fold domain-containing protein [Enterococcus sp.]